jgi:homoserine O-succinyltransferase
MPLVAHSSLPSFDALRASGEIVLSVDEAARQDIRELHVGLLNMMPDAALRATEQQFLRLVGGAGAIVQVHVHLFTVPGLERGPEASAYIDEHYETFADLRRDGLDALVVTGANVSNPNLADEPFWEPLGEVAAWAGEHVTSVLCSCLATHALVQRFHGLERRRMLVKRWGVYQHRVVAPEHPLLHGTNTRFDAPHSRWNTLSPDLLRDAGVRVLAETVDGGFHLGTSPDGFRFVYLQGHPEYDTVSLLKEYDRELRLYLDGRTEGSPPHPGHYFPPAAAAMVNAHLEEAVAARAAGEELPRLDQDAVLAQLDNTWADTGRSMFANWLGLVYRLTHITRGRPFMDGVDPHDPLGLGPPNDRHERSA